MACASGEFADTSAMRLPAMFSVILPKRQTGGHGPAARRILLGTGNSSLQSVSSSKHWDNKTRLSSAKVTKPGPWPRYVLSVFVRVRQAVSPLRDRASRFGCRVLSGGLEVIRGVRGNPRPRVVNAH